MMFALVIVDGALKKSRGEWYYQRGLRWRPLCPVSGFETMLKQANISPASKDVWSPQAAAEHAATRKGWVSKEQQKGGGYRWVTIRGNHVLVKQLADGSGVVVGGAGGKLNHFRIEKLLTKEDYWTKQKLDKEEERTVRRKKEESMTEEEVMAARRQERARKKALRSAERVIRDHYIEEVKDALRNNGKIQDVLTSVAAEVKSDGDADLSIFGPKGAGGGGGGGGGGVPVIKPDGVGEQPDMGITEAHVKAAEREAIEFLGGHYEGSHIGVGPDYTQDDLDADTAAAEQILTLRKKYQMELKKVKKHPEEWVKAVHLKGRYPGEVSDAQVSEAVRAEVANHRETLKNVELYDIFDAQGTSVQNHVDAGAAQSFNGYLSATYNMGTAFSTKAIKTLGVDNLARLIAAYENSTGEGRLKESLQEFFDSNREKVVDAALFDAKDRFMKADKIRAMAKPQGDAEAVLSGFEANGYALRHLNQAQVAIGQAVGSLQATVHLLNALEGVGDRTVVTLRLGDDRDKATKKMRQSGFKAGDYALSQVGMEWVAEVSSSKIGGFIHDNRDDRDKETQIDRIKKFKENTGWKPEGIRDALRASDIKAMEEARRQNKASTTADQGPIDPTVKMKDAQEACVRLFDAQGQIMFDQEAGLGKEQPLDANVLTPKGWVKMGDLKVGDLVISETGEPTVVLGVYPQGEKDIYRLTFSDGSSTECGLAHLWKVKIPHDVKVGNDWRVLSLQEMLEGKATVGRGHHLNAGLGTRSRKKYRIPMVQPVQFEKRSLPLDPYVVGVLIGDGGLTTGTPVVSSADDFIVEALRVRLGEEVSVVKKTAGVDYSIRSTAWVRGGRPMANPVRVALDDLGLMGKRSEEKSIPEVYLWSSIEDRVSMLRGLMDTDGWASRDGTIVQYTTVSRDLASGVQRLVWSLGGTVRITQKQPKVGQLAYTLTVNTPMCPFLLPRKAQLWHPRMKYPAGRHLVGVTSVGRKQAQCIMVADQHHTYVTDDFIVTHNTLIGTASAVHAMNTKGVKKVLYVVPASLRMETEKGTRKFLTDDMASRLYNSEGKNQQQRQAMYEKEGIHIIGHEQLRTDADMIKAAGFQMVMVDEFHKMTNPDDAEGAGQTQQWDGLMKLQDLPYKIAMTGTPIKNSKREIYKAINWLRPDHTLGTAEQFEKKYEGLNQATGIFQDAAVESIRKDLAPYMYSQKNPLKHQRKKGAIETRLASWQTAKLKEINAAYSEAKKAYQANKTPEAQKTYQTAVSNRQTAIYDVLHNVRPDNPRITTMLDTLERDHKEERAVIHVKGLNALNNLEAAIKARYGDTSVLRIDGSTSMKTRDNHVQAFNNLSNGVKFIIGTKPVGIGLNLQVGGTVTVHYDRADTPADEDQRTARVDRTGQTRNTANYFMQANHPYDLRAEDIVTKKRKEANILGNPSSASSNDDSGFLSILRRRAVA